jgi:diacylglycerol kinase family enzyme
LSGAFILLVHPGAGSGRSLSRLERLLAEDPELRARSSVCVTSSPADVLERVHGSDATAVAVGGDGTANMVATALVHEDVRRPMGVLPFGTGNAFAHSLGLGTTARAIRALYGGHTRAIDVLRTDHPAMSLALVSISCGFEARHIQRYTQLRRWTRPVAAAIALLSTAPRTSRGVRLTVDGLELVAADEAVYNAGIYNHRCYLGGWAVWPDADPGDGAGEAVVFRSLRAYGRVLMRGLRTAPPAISAGDPEWTRCTRAVLESAGPLQIDGETVVCTRIGVEVDRGALMVLVPGREERM